MIEVVDGLDLSGVPIPFLEVRQPVEAYLTSRRTPSPLSFSPSPKKRDRLAQNSSLVTPMSRYDSMTTCLQCRELLRLNCRP